MKDKKELNEKKILNLANSCFSSLTSQEHQY